VWNYAPGWLSPTHDVSCRSVRSFFLNCSRRSFDVTLEAVKWLALIMLLASLRFEDTYTCFGRLSKAHMPDLRLWIVVVFFLFSGAVHKLTYLLTFLKVALFECRRHTASCQWYPYDGIHRKRGVTADCPFLPWNVENIFDQRNFATCV